MPAERYTANWASFRGVFGTFVESSGDNQHYPSQGHRYDPAYVNATFGFDPQTPDQPPLEGAITGMTRVDRVMTATEMQAATRYLERMTLPVDSAPRSSRARGPEIYTDIEPEDL